MQKLGVTTDDSMAAPNFYISLQFDIFRPVFNL